MKPPIRNKVLTDRYVPRTDFKREHYYFHRIDPRPDIPFDDAVNEAESSWRYKAVIVVAGLIVLVHLFGWMEV